MYVYVAGRGIIPLHIPQDAGGMCTLQTVVECVGPQSGASPHTAPAPGPCPLTATADLRLLPPVRDVIVRSDRSHAAPGDTGQYCVRPAATTPVCLSLPQPAPATRVTTSTRTASPCIVNAVATPRHATPLSSQIECQ